MAVSARPGDLVSHYVAWLPGPAVAVDWTARQFWLHRPHPWVLDRAGLEELWSEVGWPPANLRK